jgi:hypothetical protein
VRLALQRGIGDCGLCALATYAELSYEDVYLAAASVDTARRGKFGATWREVARIASRLGYTPILNTEPSLEDDRGVLSVRWKRGSPHYEKPFRQHLVALDHGMIADPADGFVLPADEYLARMKAAAVALLELR